MFENFCAFFGEKNEVGIIKGDPYDVFIDLYGGRQFGNGLFNVFTKTDIKKWNDIIEKAYSEINRGFKTFGYDWLGRIFAIDEEKNSQILMFEIGTAEILEIPCDFLEFLNEEIPLFHEACLATTFYNKWLRKKRLPVVYGRCIGYKKPLFMGGKDVIRNLEDSDMDVYWYVVSKFKNA